MTQKRLLQSTTNGDSKELPKFLEEQLPIAWGSDVDHIFTQKNEAFGVNLSRVDLKTGNMEAWQTIKPKDQIGLRPMIHPVAITPDGKWMAYAYANELDQLYVSDGLR